MESSPEDTVISEELWRTWSERDKRRERATARRWRRVVAGIVMSLVAIGSAVYFGFLK